MKNSPYKGQNFAEFSLNVISTLPLRRKTNSTYNSVLAKHAYPTIGSLILNEITREATATCATRLKVVFVDICFLSISQGQEFPGLGFG